MHVENVANSTCVLIADIEELGFWPRTVKGLEVVVDDSINPIEYTVMRIGQVINDQDVISRFEEFDDCVASDETKSSSY